MLEIEKMVEMVRKLSESSPDDLADMFTEEAKEKIAQACIESDVFDEWLKS